ncbi:hypothetical protein ACJMK2_008192 [Sinanodonta woodiana]|uniref:Uncharacterized protein n=1 Tax=Sinanodonta woodiana TaxID=1069815 RepID=A0ABD3VKU0_SINWO
MTSIEKDDSGHVDESIKQLAALSIDREEETVACDVNMSQLGSDSEMNPAKANLSENAGTKKSKKRRRRQRKNKGKTIEDCDNDMDTGSTDMRQQLEFSDVAISDKNSVLQEQDIKDLAPFGKSIETARPKSCHVSQIHKDESSELINSVNGQKKKKKKKRNFKKHGPSTEEILLDDPTISLCDSVSLTETVANETQNTGTEIVDRARKDTKKNIIISGKKVNDLTFKPQITNPYPENELELQSSAACMGGNSVLLLDSSRDEKQSGHKSKGQLSKKDISHIEQIVRDIKQLHQQPKEKPTVEIGKYSSWQSCNIIFYVYLNMCHYGGGISSVN